MAMVIQRCRCQNFQMAHDEMAFKFYKRFSKYYRYIATASSNRLQHHMEYALLGKLQVNNAMSNYLNIFRMKSQWTVEQCSVGNYILFLLFFEL